MNNREWFEQNQRLIDERQVKADAEGWTWEDCRWLLDKVTEAAERALEPWKFEDQPEETLEIPENTVVVAHHNSPTHAPGNSPAQPSASTGQPKISPENPPKIS